LPRSSAAEHYNLTHRDDDGLIELEPAVHLHTCRSPAGSDQVHCRVQVGGSTRLTSLESRLRCHAKPGRARTIKLKNARGASTAQDYCCIPGHLVGAHLRETGPAGQLTCRRNLAELGGDRAQLHIGPRRCLYRPDCDNSRTNSQLRDKTIKRHDSRPSCGGVHQ